MSTRSSILVEGNIHIYHEWSDQGFVYVHNCDDDAVKLCSLEDWYKIVKYIKDNDKDCNGYDILSGKVLTNPNQLNERKEK